MCLGENEEASPWEPYHVEKGFDRDTSVVTMFSTYAISEVDHDMADSTPEAILNTACASACNRGVDSVGYWMHGRRTNHQVGVQAKEKHQLIVCPVHAAVFKRHGWSREDVRNYLYKHARIPFGRFMGNTEEEMVRRAHPELDWLWASPEALMPVLETPDCFEIIVAGAMGGARSTYSYGAAEPVSKVIESGH
jgi:hypothetical protein